LSKPKRIVVTGATGFIGRHLVETLKKKGMEPVQIDISLGNDICEERTLQDIGSFDVLVHLAGKLFVPDSFESSGDFFRTNILGTINALELCKKNNARFITLSSYVYGRPDYLPVNEDHPVRMWNPYAASKIIAEQLTQAYNRNFNLPAIILRVFNVYGHGQKEPFLFPLIINGLKRGKLVLQDPEPKRDFVYVLDLVDAIERCLFCDCQDFRVYNIGSGISYSVAQIVGIAKNVLRSNSPVVYTGKTRTTDIMDVVADVSKIRKELGWEPRYDLRSGVAHAFSGDQA
jgi:nucleoside-diphosphate-sugar epimerase